jgi:hypothetical protein
VLSRSHSTSFEPSICWAGGGGGFKEYRNECIKPDTY